MFLVFVWETLILTLVYWFGLYGFKVTRRGVDILLVASFMTVPLHKQLLLPYMYMEEKYLTLF